MSKIIVPRMAAAAAIAVVNAPAIIRARTRDAMMTFDARTIDSTGVFLVGELERLDQTLHMPLASVTWSRDIDLREDVSITDDVSSFTNSSFAAAGGPSPTGKNWIGKETTAIPGVGLDIGKTPNPMTLWGIELGWTLPELWAAQTLGRPVDQQKYEAMQLKHNMDTDEQVYIGDQVLGVTGLVNNTAVTNVSNADTGNWATATPDQILNDVNELLDSAWSAAAFAVCPSRLLLDPTNWSLLVQRKVSDAGNVSILNYLRDNSICNGLNGRPLEIYPSKWLTSRGASNTNRMVAYTKDKNRVRFPMVPLQRTPVEYRGISQITTYFGRLGVLELVYPETVAYRDGI